MDNEYWEKRALRIKQNQLAISQQYEQELSKRLKPIEHEIEKQITKFLNMYANATGKTTEQAIELIKQSDVKTWTDSLEKWQSMAVSPEYEYLHKRYMDSEYAKSQISRLEALKKQIQVETGTFAVSERDMFQHSLVSAYEDTYYRTTHSVQDQRGAYVANFQSLDTDGIKAISAQRWTSGDFSSRLWKNMVHELPQQLSERLYQAKLLGYSKDRIVREMRGTFSEFKKHELHRLINTEMANITESATLNSYKDQDVEMYEYMATLEVKTCGVCGGLDSKKFPVKDAVAGTNYAPMHPNCRCTTAPWIPEMELLSGERWARNPVTGKGERVERMSYDEWRDKYVDEDTQRSIRFNEKRKKYDKDFDVHVDQLGAHKLPNKEIYAKTMFEGGRNAKLMNTYLSDRTKKTIEPLTDYRLYYELDARLKNEVIGQYTSDNRIIEDNSMHLISRIIGAKEEVKYDSSGNPKVDSKGDEVTERREGVSIDNLLYTLQHGDVSQSAHSDNVMVYKSEYAKVTLNKNSGNIIQVSPQKRKKGHDK